MAQYKESSSSLIAFTAVMGSASTLAVLLRLLARKHSKTPLGLDDAFAAAALCGFLTLLGIVIWESYNGLGYPFRDLPSKVLENELKALYLSRIFRPVPPGMGRFSLLFLYNRIFKSDYSFSIAVRIVGILNGLWYVGCTVALGLRCVPLEKMRNPLIIEGQCFHSSSMALVVTVSILDSLLDFMVMILPISVLRRIQMSWRRKINVAMVFAVGGFVGLIGFLRSAVTYEALHSESYLNDLWLWIQLALCVICCCLPTYGLLSLKEKILTPAKDLCSKLIRKIISPFMSRVESVLGSDSPKIPGLMPQFRRSDIPSNGEADGVGLTHTAGKFEPEEQHVPGRDFSIEAVSVKSAVEMV